MTVEVGGAGFVGVGFEAVLGTFVPATKWIPIRSESLVVAEDKQYRMNLRGLADRSGALLSYTHVEGDIEFEVNPEFMPYFLYASRVTPAKSGAGPYTYTFTPAHVAKTTTAAGVTNRKTLSIVVQRSNQVFAYVGCAVSQLAFTIDAGMLLCTASIVGTNEATQTLGTPTYTTVPPVSPGQVTLEVPTASARADADTLSLTINDNLVPANRLNGSRFSAYQNWGEREITLTYEVDFDLKANDYDAFRAGTFRTTTIKGIVTPAVEEIQMVLNATAIDAAPVNLAGLGDVNRLTVDAHAFYNTAAAYTATVITNENTGT